MILFRLVGNGQNGGNLAGYFGTTEAQVNQFMIQQYDRTVQ